MRSAQEEEQTTERDDPLSQPDSLFNTLPGWTWVGCYGGYYLTADHLHDAGFEHGFFTRRWQGRGPDELAAYLSCGVSVHRLGRSRRDVFEGLVLVVRRNGQA